MASWAANYLSKSFWALLPSTPAPTSDRLWCEGPHIVTERPLSGEEHEYTEVLPLFPDLSFIKYRTARDDGNCLFHAIGMFLNRDASAVRQAVAAYLKEHQAEPFLAEHMLLAMQEHNERCDEQCAEAIASFKLMHEQNFIDQATLDQQCHQATQKAANKKITSLAAYLAYIAQDTTFGGDVEIYAAAHCFGISIGAYEERGFYKPSFICAPPNATEGQVCKLLYTRTTRHYDLIVG